MEVLLCLENILQKCLGSREVCIIVYIDLKVAFDTVWSKGLIQKLINGGIKGNMNRWVYKYFIDRKNKSQGRESVFECSKDEYSNSTVAVIQSPLLFNLMISDMPKNELINKYIYADYITFACKGKN